MKLPRLDYVVLLLAAAGAVQSAETTPLLEAGTSWNGGAIHYPEGVPQVTAVKIRLKNGEATPIHCHPVPLFAYILKGQLRVTTGLGQSRVFKRGEALVEVMDTWHQGKAVKGPVELVAFYAGVEGTEVSELQGSGTSDCQP
jgi:quercetin dioxygenase-like cupin family protein